VPEVPASVLEHVADRPDHAGSWWVFQGGPDAARAVVQEAVARAAAGGPDVESYTDRRGNTSYTVQMHRPVGFEGGASGRARGNPVVYRIKFQLENGRIRYANPVGAHNVREPRLGQPVRLSALRRFDRVPQRLPAGLSPAAYAHTALGVPSDPQRDPAHAGDYLVVSEAGSVLSYNAETRGPNWVAWSTTAADLGNVERSDDFRLDNDLPPEIGHATLEDYSGSGYDRGHVMPSGERTASQPANSATFELTNMLPQASNSNQGPWQHLEHYARDIAARPGTRVYQYAGPIYTRGQATSAIGGGVAVPDAHWKIVVVTENGRPPSAASRVIAVVVPNDNRAVSITNSFTQYRTTVADLESRTGLRFFSNLPPAVADALRQQIDTTQVPDSPCPRFMTQPEWDELRRADQRARAQPRGN
jgi:DNA/RNA endonuclease G (NUC1)